MPATLEESWSTQQLAEFLAIVSSFADEQSARRGAVERAAEALDAEVAAVIQPGEPVVAVGFPRGETPAMLLREVAEDGITELDVPHVGECRVVTVAIDDEPPGWLLVARRGDEGFSAQEVNLLNGMGRVLVLALQAVRLLSTERALRESSERQADENARLLRELQERQILLERLTRIQRSIVRRTVLHDVLDAIVEGAAELIGDEVVGLHLIDPATGDRLVTVASRGLAPATREATRHPVIGFGAAGKAVQEGRLVVVEDYQHAGDMVPAMVEQRLQAAMAAPVHENGELIGSLSIGSFRPGRQYRATEREALLAFAEHASLALTDARNFDNALHQAHHDPLTDLPNRALLLDRLEQALARTERAASSVAVLYIDLDNFKRVNDSFGHAAGDELLIDVANRLTDVLRPVDTAARFGGDEFAVLLEDMSAEEDAIRVASRVMLALQAPFFLSGREISITASIGIAVHHGHHNEDLLRNADLALYRAKSAGKARYEAFEPSMHAAMVERMELELGLQTAVLRDEFVLVYQPIVSLVDAGTVAVEALVRWDHPTRGRLAPGDFITVAEETGAILEIGRWVLGEACRRGAAWNAALAPADAISINVNLSVVQLQEPGLVEAVAAELEASGLDPSLLILEITETLLMHDVDHVSATLGRLKATGVRIAVDDFGTGYSSLQYLRRFPIDILKIDKSFIDGIGEGADEVMLARAIIDLGASFDLRVIAEGIEHESQVHRLLEFGCAFGQGYHFARPMDGDAIELELGKRALAAGPRRGL